MTSEKTNTETNTSEKKEIEASSDHIVGVLLRSHGIKTFVASEGNFDLVTELLSPDSGDHVLNFVGVKTCGGRNPCDVMLKIWKTMPKEVAEKYVKDMLLSISKCRSYAPEIHMQKWTVWTKLMEKITYEQERLSKENKQSLPPWLFTCWDIFCGKINSSAEETDTKKTST